MMELETETKRFFSIIQPYCAEVARRPVSLNSLLSLKSILSSSTDVDTKIWNRLFDYIIFPLRICIRDAIQSENSTNEKRTSRPTDECLTAVLDILQVCALRADDIQYYRLISDGVLLINNPPGSDTLCENVELMIAVFRFVDSVLNHYTDDLKRNCELDNDKSSNSVQPILAQTVFALLRCLRRKRTDRLSVLNDVIISGNDRERELQSIVLSCLTTILRLTSPITVSFLPGVSQTLAEFIIEIAQLTSSFSKDILSSALALWIDIVIMVQDSENSTDEWRRNTALRLGILFNKFTPPLVSCQSDSVRMELVRGAVKICDSCDRQRQLRQFVLLQDCRKRALEILVSSLSDDSVALIINRRSVIDCIQRSWQQDDLISQLILSTCQRLARLSSRSTLFVQQRMDWQTLAGCFESMTEKDLHDFLFVEAHRQILFDGLCQSLQFAEIVVEIAPAYHQSNEHMECVSVADRVRSIDRIPLSSPTELVGQQLLRKVCSLLSSVGDLRLLYDHLYLMCQSTICESQAIYLVNTISEYLLQRGMVLPDDSSSNFVEYFLQRLRDQKLASDSSALTRLLLDGIGWCALSLRNRFQSTLVEAFYLILLQMRLPECKQFAWDALSDISTALGHSTVATMVVDNADYLASSITIRLRRLTFFPDTPYVLSALIDVLPWNSIAAFRGPISETLTAIDQCIMSERMRRFAPSLLRVLERFCWKCSSSQTTVIKSEESENSDDIDDTRKKPWHVKLIVECLQRARSWICTNCAKTQTAALQLLDEGLKALADFEDDLLPMIHQTWPSVLARLNQTYENGELQAAVSTTAFAIMCTMGNLSKSFVFHRVTEEAWPVIKSAVLQRHLPVCKRANWTVYRQNPICQLQLYVLQNLGDLYRNIGARGKSCREPVELCSAYCDATQVPPALVEAAQKSLSVLNAIATDTVSETANI